MAEVTKDRHLEKKMIVKRHLTIFDQIKYHVLGLLQKILLWSVLSSQVMKRTNLVYRICDFFEC